MIKGMIKWTVVLSVTFLLLFHVWKILIFTCSLPYGLFWSASQSPDEYKLMWILTDLMSFVLILLIFFFHRWKTHTHTHTHLPRIQYIQPVFWCNRDVSLSIKLKMCFQMERERTGLLHGQQDQVGRWHLQQI